MAQKTIKINVEGNANTLELNQLEAFQEDIKTLAKEQYEQMRDNIVKNGYSFVIHVWQSKGKNYIIDGHQRMFTLKQLQDAEGYKVPALPVAFVKAKTYEEAKRLVLAGASVYGRVNEQNLHNYMMNNNITYEEMAAEFDLPGVDYGAMAEQFMNMTLESHLPEPQANTPEMKSSSDQVKQVVLLFNAENYQEFMTKAEALSKIYGTENITDTVMEALRAHYNAKLSKS